MTIGTVEYLPNYSVQGSIPVSAGIGQFNVSQVSAWDSSLLAFFFSIASYNLLYDTTSSFAIDPPICYGSSCSSYYLSGGLAFVDPDPFDTPRLFSESDIVIVRDTQGILASFSDLSSEEIQSSHNFECSTFGFSAGAFQLCIAQSNINTGQVVAGSLCFP